MRGIRTTNAIERQFREVRRRMDPMACFANEASADRILYAIFTYANDRWATSLLIEFADNSCHYRMDGDQASGIRERPGGESGDPRERANRRCTVS